MADFKGYIPKRLIDSIELGKCILFVGAGLSANVRRSDGRPLPLWKTLLEELLEWVCENGIIHDKNYCEQVNEIIRKGDLLMAAQAIQDKMNESQLGKFLKSVFGGSVPSNTHCLIPCIPFKALLTTNYDTLIEGAYAKTQGMMPPVFTQEDLEGNLYLSNRDKFYVFKIHGDMNRPKTIALGSRDYQELFFKKPDYRQFIESLFMYNTVLFIGFGGNDPDVEDILNKFSVMFSGCSDEHYILLPAGMKNEVEKTVLAKNKRLRVIDYPIDENGGHSQVDEFFREIIARLGGNLLLESSGGEDYLKVQDEIYKGMSLDEVFEKAKKT